MSGYLPEPTGPLVMPVVHAEQRPNGVALTRPGGGNLSIVFPLIGVLFLVIAIPLGIFSSSATVVAWLLGLAGAGALGHTGWRLYRRATLGTAELLFPTMPVRLAEPMIVRFQQRRTSRAQIQQISATLRCDEWVRYRVGTDTRTDVDLLWQTTLQPEVNDPLGAAELMRGAWKLRLPPDLPPSFDAPSNKIRWTLTVTVDVPGRPDVRNDFVIPVAPEVVRDLR